MKNRIIKGLLIISLLLMSGMVSAQSDDGSVPFDCPDVPSSQFKFDLSSDVIALLMADPTADVAPLFKNVNNLSLRNYRNRSKTFTKMVAYYSEALSGRGWRALGQNAHADPEKVNLYIYSLHENETAKGIFILVSSEGGIYLINIVGEIPLKELGTLLLNLDQLGIEIRELMSLKSRDLELAPLSPPRSEPLKPAPESPTTEKPETPEPPQLLDWFVDGKPISELHIQSEFTAPKDTDPKWVEKAIDAERDNIMKLLKNGSGELREVIPVLASGLDDSRGISISVREEGTKRIAIINLVPTEKISVLRSMNISGTDRHRKVHISVDDRIMPQGYGTTTPLEATRFWAKEAPIHEVHIRGNRKVPEARIRQTLENGSPDIDKALKTLFKVMPHFKEIDLQVKEDGKRNIATITVTEKPLSTDVYLGFNPMISSGFNRVNDYELGTRFEVGKRKEVGPLWLWHFSDERDNPLSKLFGEVSYMSGNPRFHYRFGGTTNWGKPYIWNLGLTVQLHRLTDAIAAELFPNYNSDESLIFRTFGGLDYPNYYLRQGAEIALQWQPVMPLHFFTLAMVTESHDSLQKSTDWSVANWRSRRKVRENPSITPGTLRSITFQYDFDRRVASLGWHNTFLMEHSRSDFGSDFDFTRYQLHFRYAYPLGKHRIRTRLLLGFANARLPIQRQFAISGPGGLRGYPLFAPADAAEREATRNWHKHSLYAFAGDGGFLFNIEYLYALAQITDLPILKWAYVIAFLDEGQVWHASDPAYVFDPSGNIGIGLQFGEGDSVARINIARALNFNTAAKERLLTAPGYVLTSTWHHVF